MTSEEIDLLLANSEKSIRLEILSTPLVGWTLSLGSGLMGVVFSRLQEGLVFAIPLALVSFLVSFSHYSDWSKVKVRRAQLIWEHLIKTAFGTRLNGVSAELTKDIAYLYQADPRGEILPLSQAIRLVDTHHKQQQRLEVVISRLGQLRSVGAVIKHKTELLRGLGENHREGEARLQNLHDDEAALDIMRTQIQASCHRLEMILSESQKALQMRQLHREISALSREGAHGRELATNFASESLIDIERQITREIETFLQLERETDRHLREL